MRMILYVAALLVSCLVLLTNAFAPQLSPTTRVGAISSTAVYVKGYEPKWTKKKTLSEQDGGSSNDFIAKGLKGSVSVVFRQGNATKTTITMPGTPLRDVASQAGQFIKYGCGKGTK